MCYRFENDLGHFTQLVAAGEASGKGSITRCIETKVKKICLAKVEEQPLNVCDSICSQMQEVRCVMGGGWGGVGGREHPEDLPCEAYLPGMFNRLPCSLLESPITTHFIDHCFMFTFQIHKMVLQRKFNKKDERNICY